MREELNRITGIIVDSAFRIHRDCGPGLFESVYERLLGADLPRRGLKVERQKLIDINFDGIIIESAFKIDLLVEGLVIVEIKSVESLSRLHEKQLLTYLRLTGCKVGLVINFNVPIIKAGIRRIVNGI
jgi:GxxExxY protein